MLVDKTERSGEPTRTRAAFSHFHQVEAERCRGDDDPLAEIYLGKLISVPDAKRVSAAVWCSLLCCAAPTEVPRRRLPGTRAPRSRARHLRSPHHRAPARWGVARPHRCVSARSATRALANRSFLRKGRSDRRDAVRRTPRGARTRWARVPLLLAPPAPLQGGTRVSEHRDLVRQVSGCAWSRHRHWQRSPVAR